MTECCAASTPSLHSLSINTPLKTPVSSKEHTRVACFLSKKKKKSHGPGVGDPQVWADSAGKVSVTE